MAYIFGDSFDLYATMADPIAGYWDSGLGVSANNTLVAGRFAGSQALHMGTALITSLVKSSSVTTDPVHHITVAFRQTAALSGTVLGSYFQLSDGATNQCCIVFRSDGAILLTSATPAGTVLATYTGAVTAQNTWFAFEFEIIISNTVGRFRARKNGNTTDDFDSGATLNTRPGASTQANKLTLGVQASVNAQEFDDLLWRSDASSVAWVGDIRCYARLPASDASTQFSRSSTSYTLTPQAPSATLAVTNGTALYLAFTPTYDGAVGSVIIPMGTGYTGNMKCSIFASSGSAPTTVLGSATPITNPATGSNTFTFGTPVAVTKGTQYWVGVDSDTSSGFYSRTAAAAGLSSATAYSTFPVASPTTASVNTICPTIIVSIVTNAVLVNEAQQDGATSYVYDSTVNDADFYNIASLGVTPASVVAVTTRGFMAKSDAGARTAAVRLKSGSTTVAAPTVSLSTNFGWSWRTDLTDPDTSAAWTTTAVNAATIGPFVVS